MVLLVAAVVAAVVIGIAVLAARDMDRRGRSGELYAVAILFVLPLGLLMWGLDRRRPPTEPDPDPGMAEPGVSDHAPDGAVNVDVEPASQAAQSSVQNRRE